MLEKEGPGYLSSFPAWAPANNQIQHSFAFVTDIAPTLLDLAGRAPPDFSSEQPAYRTDDRTKPCAGFTWRIDYRLSVDSAGRV